MIMTNHGSRYLGTHLQAHHCLSSLANSALKLLPFSVAYSPAESGWALTSLQSNVTQDIGCSSKCVPLNDSVHGVVSCGFMRL